MKHVFFLILLFPFVSQAQESISFEVLCKKVSFNSSKYTECSIHDDKMIVMEPDKQEITIYGKNSDGSYVKTYEIYTIRETYSTRLQQSGAVFYTLSRSNNRVEFTIYKDHPFIYASQKLDNGVFLIEAFRIN